MDKKQFKKLIRECIEEVLVESFDDYSEKIYKDRQGGVDVYWMDSEGEKVYIKPDRVNLYLRRGYRLVDLKDANESLSQDDAESPLYVEYVKPMTNETPFVLNGEKFEYCWAKYPNGKIDIGVYAYHGDMCYGYQAFRQKYNIQEDFKDKVNGSNNGNFEIVYLQNGKYVSIPLEVNDLETAKKAANQWRVKNRIKHVIVRNKKQPEQEIQLDEMTSTGAVAGFQSKNWVDPDPERKKMKSIAAKSVGGKTA
jgi:hypothetical protein